MSASKPSEPSALKLPKLGNYQALQHIATGGMGAVYKALDTKHGWEVALKVLAPQFAAKPTLLKRFKKEASHCTKLNHENIVKFYEFGEEKGIHYLAMEFVEGEDLHEYVHRKKKLPVKESRAILIQATKAIGHLHKNGIIHRDIKPSNFLIVTKDGKILVKLIDLGLARQTSEEEDQESRITRAGSTLGTIDYMAPEQARDGRSADIRSDIYSLGCTWYHLLAGRPPFAEGSAMERVYKHINTPPADIRELNPEVPVDVKEIIERMLAKDPGDRFATPAQLLRALEGKDRHRAPIENDLLAQLAVGEDETAAPPSRVPVFSQSMFDDGDDEPVDDESADDEAEATAGAATLRQNWLLWAAGATILLGFITASIGWWALRHHAKPKVLEETTNPLAPIPDTVPEPASASMVPVKSTSVTPAPVESGPPKPVVPEAIAPQLPRLYQPLIPINVAELKKEFFSPWPPISTEVGLIYQVSRVRRGNDPKHFDSLDAALTAANNATTQGRSILIEIHDNGPLFVHPGAIKGHHVLIRAGKGYRPLIAWDREGAAAKSNDLIQVTEGSLSLENLDLAVKGTEPSLSDTVLFHTRDADFSAIDCTLSEAGSQSHPVILARVEALRGDSHAKCRLSRCYLRGLDMVAVDVAAAGTNVMVDDCLIVGSNQPVLDMVGPGPLSPITIHLFRSTLVGGENCLRIKHAGRANSAPAVQMRAWDSLLARAGSKSAGIMVSLSQGAETSAIRWQAVNCLYLGWKTLLTNGAKAANDMSEWRKLWPQNEGDKALTSNWPTVNHSDPGQTPAAEYRTKETPAGFAATSNLPSSLGCDVDSLPQGRDCWMRLTFGPNPLAPINLPTKLAPPEPFGIQGNIYYGQRLDMNQVKDLGKFLQEWQNAGRLANKVVLRLSGADTYEVTPFHLKNVHLTIYFESGPKPTDRPTLRLSGDSGPDQSALIDIENGNLDIFDGSIRFLNSKLAQMPEYMIKVKGGELNLHGGSFEGPVLSAPSYRGLIRFEGAPEATSIDRTPACTINGSVLISDKTCMDIIGPGSRVRVNNSVVVAAENAIHLDFSGAANPSLNTHLMFDHNTFAFRDAWMLLGDAIRLSAPADPALIAANSNVYMYPFADKSRSSTLLLCEGLSLSRAVVAWKGQGNVYDKRLHSFAAVVDESSRPIQAYAVWTHLWGPANESRGLWADLPSSLNLENDLQKQLVRLKLPSSQFKTKPLPGADFVKLGIAKAPKKTK